MPRWQHTANCLIALQRTPPVITYIEFFDTKSINSIGTFVEIIESNELKNRHCNTQDFHTHAHISLMRCMCRSPDEQNTCPQLNTNSNIIIALRKKK